MSKEGFSFTFSLTGLVSNSLGPLLGILFGRAHIGVKMCAYQRRTLTVTNRDTATISATGGAKTLSDWIGVLYNQSEV